MAENSQSNAVAFLFKQFKGASIMGLFGNLFSGEQPSPEHSEQQVNPDDGVDLLNNATSSEQPGATAQTESAAIVPGDVEAAETSGDATVEPTDSSQPQPSAEATPIADVDAEAVAANVDQQLAGAGFELSGQVVVQSEPAMESTTEDVTPPTGSNADASETSGSVETEKLPDQPTPADLGTPESV